MVTKCFDLVSVSCGNHKYCLFQNPLCKTQPLDRRIANIAFHIFTLCIPLVIYHLREWLSQRKIQNETTKTPPKPEILFKKIPEEEKKLSDILVEIVIANVKKKCHQAHQTPDCSAALLYLGTDVGIKESPRLENLQWADTTPQCVCLHIENVQKLCDDERRKAEESKYPDTWTKESQHFKHLFVLSLLALENLADDRALDFPKQYHHLKNKESRGKIYEMGRLEYTFRLLYNAFCSAVLELPAEQQERFQATCRLDLR